jgi:predicted transcriptional regulator
MGDMKPADQFTSTEEDVEVDEETLAAIDREIKAADQGRVVPLEEVRRRMQEWHTKSSSRKTLEP